MSERRHDVPRRSRHNEPHDAAGDVRPPSFWRSRTGFALIAGLVVVGVLLAYEHRVHILGSGWFVWLLLLICVGMHFFMHGSHGGHDSTGDKS